MNEQPKVRLQTSGLDKVLEAIGVLLLLALWIYSIVNYRELPDTIPTHFNMSGQADGFGNKQILWMLPTLVTLIYGGLSLLNKYPHLFNYPSAINLNNAELQYIMATRLIRCLKISVILLFGLITIHTINSGQQGPIKLGDYLMPATLILILAPLMVYLFKAKTRR